MSNNRVSVEVKYPQWTCIFCWQAMTTLPPSSWKFMFPGKSTCSWKAYKPDIRVSGIQGDIRDEELQEPD